MRNLKSKIVFYVMLTLCVALGILYASSQIGRSIDARKTQKDFDRQLKQKDSLIMSIGLERDSLSKSYKDEKIRFRNYIVNMKRADSIRANVKKRKNEKSDIIDAANYIELGNILSGYLE